jgi:uncharacterized protein (DUF697 family)
MEDTRLEKEESEKSEFQEKETEKIIKRHMYAAMGLGLIPVPFLDFAGIAGVQMMLIRKLARIYNIAFSSDIIKNLIGALLGGSAAASGGPVLGSLIKTVPVVGQAIGIVGTPIVSGASTYAIGRLFERHFIEGESFLTLDHEKSKKFYEEMFKEGMNISAEIKAQKI